MRDFFESARDAKVPPSRVLPPITTCLCVRADYKSRAGVMGRACAPSRTRPAPKVGERVC